MTTLIEEQQLYENLCLLGICGALAKPLTGSQGLDLKPTTFRKPSSRAIEFVLYHLYAILLGEERANKVGVKMTAAARLLSDHQSLMLHVIGPEEFLPCQRRLHGQGIQWACIRLAENAQGPEPPGRPQPSS